jgi:CubicO group peptidase (beta-lactamase class C family)
MHLRRLALLVSCVAAVVVVSLPVVASQATAPAASAASQSQAVDAAFAAWTKTTPGCAVGVSEQGRVVLEKAYGMADLEHDAPNLPSTIFEAGSVSKQFTAAAVLMLVKDGRIGLDDPVQKYIPELRDYGAPLTIRHLLTHTSGLRDWGSLAGIAGMPRGSRAYTHGHVVDILSRQVALNFVPGTKWSYSNSGYNLAAVIVARVSGMSFAEFSRTRVFQPIGLTHTSWRDDFTRVVPGRAIAYDTAPGNRYAQDMPFENVHGNGGLLTTVGDLLKWNEALATGSLSGIALANQQQTMATLPDGRALHYGFGVFRGDYKGVPEVYHSGATAGYRAFLTYYPSARLSVAVLCNAGNANATQLTRAVSDLYLGDRLKPNAPRTPVLPEAQGPLVGVAADATYKPTSAELDEFVGPYESREVETWLRVERVGGALVIHRRPDQVIPLRPHSKDRFEAGAGLGLITFRRVNGKVDSFSVTQDRVWDLRFTRGSGGVAGTWP